MTFLANPKLILMRNNMIARQDDMPNANFEFATNPTATTNPLKVNMSWLNTLTGEIFVCTDNTVDNNVWIGTLGTNINKLWTPDEESPYLWFDAQDADTLVGGANISQWINKGSSSLSFDQATGADQPAYDATGLNGYPCLDFDGTSDFMATTTPDLGNGVSSLFIVAESTTLAGDRSPLSQNYVSSPLSPWQIYLNATGMLVDWRTGANSGAGYISANVPFILSEIQDPITDVQMWANGNLGTVGTGSSLFPDDQIIYIGKQYTVGALGWWSGPIAEILLFKQEMPPTLRQKVEGYLAWKYGLQASLAVGHPYITEAPRT